MTDMTRMTSSNPSGLLFGLDIEVMDNTISIGKGEAEMVQGGFARHNTDWVANGIAKIKASEDAPMMKPFFAYLIARPWWHRWVFFWKEQVTFMFSEKADAPTLPRGFSKYRKIGVVFSNGSGGLRNQSTYLAGVEFKFQPLPDTK